MRCSLSGLAVLVLAVPAAAQGVPPRAPDAAPPATTKQATAPDDLDDAGEPPANKTKTGSSEPAKPAKAPSLPPPPDPRVDEQEPRPFLRRGSVEPERHVEVGPDVGIWSRPAKGDSVEYEPGFAWGGHVRVELFRELGLRASFSNSTHSVNVPLGGLGLDGTEVQQPDLEVLQLGARLEPTWMPAPTLRLWAGLGMAWARATAPEPSSSVGTPIRYADRSGVFLEYSGALGATWDFVPGWLAVSLSISGGLLADQSGDLFHEHQVSDGSGGLTRLHALPEFSSSLSAHLGVGMLL